MRRGFDDVIIGGGEIFPQHGDLNAGSCGFDVAETALKEAPVGKDAERRRTAGRISLGDFRRSEIFREESFTGGSFFDFRDDRGSVGCERYAEWPALADKL